MKDPSRMHMDFPRVLHVGYHPIGAPTNSGLTLGTMFGGWPEARLLQVCQRPHDAVADSGSILMFPKSTAPVDLVLRGTFGTYGRIRRSLGKTSQRETDGMNNSVRRSSELTVKQRLFLTLNTVNDISPVQIGPKIRRQVRAFEPQVIHSLLGGVRTMRLTLELSRVLELPIVPHFMDDWIDNLFTQGQLGGHARAQTEKVFDEILDRTPWCLTIGEDMRKAFEARLDRPCSVVGNSVDPSDYVDYTSSTPRSFDGTLTLRYVGGLHLGRDVVIAALASSVQGRTFRGHGWRLELYVPGDDAGRAQRLVDRFPDFVSHRGSLDPHQVPETLGTSNALLFLESDDPGIVDFTRLSVSTKVPQYLASNRPVLVVGPHDQGSVRALNAASNSVYPGARPVPARLLQSLDTLTEMALLDLHGAPGRHAPDFLVNFGQKATRERLREALSAAALAGLPRHKSVAERVT